jgi:hypothetical protein
MRSSPKVTAGTILLAEQVRIAGIPGCTVGVASMSAVLKSARGWVFSTRASRPIPPPGMSSKSALDDAVPVDLRQHVPVEPPPGAASGDLVRYRE